MSKRDILIQACTGIAIKSLVILFTLGHDFEIALDRMSTLAHGRKLLSATQKREMTDFVDITVECHKETSPQAGERLRSVMSFHEKMVETEGLRKTTQAASVFANEVDKVYDDIDGPPTWNDPRTKPEHVFYYGAAEAANAKVVELVVEEPMQKTADKASGSKSSKSRGSPAALTWMGSRARQHS